MSLYDGLGLDSKDKSHKAEPKPELAGWSSGIKLLQSQLQLKKAALTQVKREKLKTGAVLPPVLDLKSRREEQDEMPPPPSISFAQGREAKVTATPTLLGGEWDVHLEYDPMWPNDYEKIMKERREQKEREREEEKRREMEERERRRRERYERHRELERSNRGERDRSDRSERDREREEEEEEERYSRRGLTSGTAIAPPPSLLESSERREPSSPPHPLPSSLPPGLGSSVAARIMAKYGFKEGQGLGKQEQGMSRALQVEKTSKRGGKIIHEKDIPKDLTPPPPPPPAPPMPPPAVPTNTQQQESITEMLKNPSKVVLLRNMVGPGEVDEDLEPETKEECSKYGEVVRCLIFEIPGGNVPDDEAVRIFIEFKRMESAIKAVVDLHGRYFGGRVVRAGFYNYDRFKRFELAD